MRSLFGTAALVVAVFLRGMAKAILPGWFKLKYVIIKKWGRLFIN